MKTFLQIAKNGDPEHRQAKEQARAEKWAFRIAEINTITKVRKE